MNSRGAATIMIVLIVTLVGCTSGTSVKQNTCGDLLLGDAFDRAMDYVDFMGPLGWTTVQNKSKYTNGSSELNVYAFNSYGASVKGCLERVYTFFPTLTNLRTQYPPQLIENPDFPNGSYIWSITGQSTETNENFYSMSYGFLFNGYIYIFVWGYFDLNEFSQSIGERQMIIRTIDFHK